MTAPLTLVWSTEPCRHGRQGKRFVLRCPDIPKSSMSPLCGDDRLAVCTQGGRVWEAVFWIGYDSIRVVSGTFAKAMRELQAKLEARSDEIFEGRAIAFCMV